MNFTTTILDGLVRGSFSGQYNRELVNEYVTMVINYCKYKQHKRLFFDFRNVDGEVVEYERYKLAEHLASLEPGDMRIAAVVTEVQSQPAKVAEVVANAKNLNVRISTDESEVMNWLINDVQDVGGVIEHN